MTTKISLLIGALVLATAGSASAAALQLHAPGADDSVPVRLDASPQKRASALEIQPLKFSWRLDDQAPLTAVSAPEKAQSKEYWDTRGAAEMAFGVTLPTTSAGAIVRLSPVAGASTKALEARRVLLSKDGVVYANGTGMQAIADSEELAKGAASFGEGTTVFRIDPALGHGNFKLQIPHASGDTIVHVFEPHSAWQLEVKADRVAYVAGGKIRVEARMLHGQNAAALKEIAGLIVSPDGQTREFSYRADKAGRYSAEVPADFVASATPALFEIHAFASAQDQQMQVLRDARVAFAYAAPGARFTGAVNADPAKSAQAVTVDLEIEVARASRYQVGGVLYGSFKDGLMRPVAMAQSAMLLDAGVQSITLEYSPEALAGTKASAPFEIRDLQLVDQATMGMQEQRVLGLRLPSAN